MLPELQDMPRDAGWKSKCEAESGDRAMAPPSRGMPLRSGRQSSGSNAAEAYEQETPQDRVCQHIFAEDPLQAATHRRQRKPRVCQGEVVWTSGFRRYLDDEGQRSTRASHATPLTNMLNNLLI